MPHRRQCRRYPATEAMADDEQADEDVRTRLGFVKDQAADLGAVLALPERGMEMADEARGRSSFWHYSIFSQTEPSLIIDKATN